MHPKLLAQTEFQPLSLRCVLKMCSPELSPVFAKLYNKCLAESCFPSCWKSSFLLLVRSLSLLLMIAWLNILTSLTFFLIFSMVFRAFRSTADIPTVLNECTYNSLDAGGETRAIALDISMAFDKLKSYGAVGTIPHIFESFLQELSLKVVLDGH